MVSSTSTSDLDFDLNHRRNKFQVLLRSMRNATFHCHRPIHFATRLFLLLIILASIQFTITSTTRPLIVKKPYEQQSPSAQQSPSTSTSKSTGKIADSVADIELLGPAVPFIPKVLNTSLVELDLHKTFFFLYSHPLPPNFKLLDPVVLNTECGENLRETDLCLGHGAILDLRSFRLPKKYYGNRCGSFELTDSTFCVNQDTVVDLALLNLKQRTAFYDRLLDLVPEPEPDRRIFAPPSPNVPLEIVLQEMIPIKSPRLVKTIFNIANTYGGTGASLTLLVCPIHYPDLEFLQEEEGHGWKGINIIQLGREYGPEEFQEMLTSQWLSEYYEGKQVLLMHPDTMLLRPLEESMIGNGFDILGKPYSFKVNVTHDPPTPPLPPKKKMKTVKKIMGADPLAQNFTDAISRASDEMVKHALKNKEKRDSSNLVTGDSAVVETVDSSSTVETDAVETASEETAVETASVESAVESAVETAVETAVVSEDVEDPEETAAEDSEVDNSEAVLKKDEEVVNKETSAKEEESKGDPIYERDVVAEGATVEEGTEMIEEEEEVVDEGNSTSIEAKEALPFVSLEMMSVGNTATGYSLRRLEKIREVVAANPDGQKPIPEDKYWYNEMKPAPPEIAIRFSISSDIEVELFANSTYMHVPTGVYGPWKFPQLFGKLGGRMFRQFVRDNVYQIGEKPSLRFISLKSNSTV